MATRDPFRASTLLALSASIPLLSASFIGTVQAGPGKESRSAPTSMRVHHKTPTVRSAPPLKQTTSADKTSALHQRSPRVLPSRTVVSAGARLDATPAISLVDPMIGAGGIGWGVGSIVPGPTLPSGMVKLSPDTTNDDFDPSFAHCGGYWYPDTHIRGFSHNHLVGTGASDQGNILVTPLIGIDDRKVSEAGYRSPYSHDTEVAEVGYYAVTLNNGNIRAELTATERVGLHRYTFPATNESTLLFDLGASIPDGYVTDIDFEILPGSQEIVGSLTNMGGLSDRYGGQRIYFSAKMKTPFDRFGVFADGNVFEDRTSIEGERVGAWVQYTTTQNQTLEVAVGISYVSVANAQLNRELEADNTTFDEARAQAEAAWEDTLSAIQIVGGSTAQQRIFYSALYHSMMMPTLYTDVNDQYRGFDGGVHTAAGFTYYTDFSMWDTFRTLHPLITLINPTLQGDFNTSLLRMYQQSGFIDRWPQGNGPTGCMVGDSAAIVISDSYLKGVRNFDESLAWEALWKAASFETSGKHRDHLSEYETLGYVPVESGGRSTSATLEYAYNDAALANFAHALGHTREAGILEDRALRYQNHYNPETGYLQGRAADGSFVTPFVPKYSAEYYAEGNALQWSWYAPHDIAGLISLFGGPLPFERRLDQFFSRSEEVRDTLFPDMNYWHGNEPDLHASWLYHWIGKPEKSMEWVRWVLETKYSDTPDGLDGNDDGGTLSAWYVLASMGLFPIAGTDFYLIGTPLFDQMTLNLEGGDFKIIVTNQAPENLYIQAAYLNGQPWNQSWLTHDRIQNGGVLELMVGPTPSTWAHTGSLPPSLSTQ